MLRLIGRLVKLAIGAVLLLALVVAFASTRNAERKPWRPQGAPAPTQREESAQVPWGDRPAGPVPAGANPEGVLRDPSKYTNRELKIVQALSDAAQLAAYEANRIAGKDNHSGEWTKVYEPIRKKNRSAVLERVGWENSEAEEVEERVVTNGGIRGFAPEGTTLEEILSRFD